MACIQRVFRKDKNKVVNVRTVFGIHLVRKSIVPKGKYAIP